ncbi:hypothetical protein FIBSPDRAFT_882852 [Athelia psychrophila]|uniref:Uncharacterized protein n=1 Tax=Athelia psychrophila TaxID=1759441 RepID=A0A166USK9_9AGAM|nr:hypothetical protein FIBSPDRAFT_882852 [Fibularhizoctonia sp. CBS 109695]
MYWVWFFFSTSRFSRLITELSEIFAGFNPPFKVAPSSLTTQLAAAKESESCRRIRTDSQQLLIKLEFMQNLRVPTICISGSVKPRDGASNSVSLFSLTGSSSSQKFGFDLFESRNFFNIGYSHDAYVVYAEGNGAQVRSGCDTSLSSVSGWTNCYDHGCRDVSPGEHVGPSTCRESGSGHAECWGPGCSLTCGRASDRHDQDPHSGGEVCDFENFPCGVSSQEVYGDDPNEDGHPSGSDSVFFAGRSWGHSSTTQQEEGYHNVTEGDSLRTPDVTGGFDPASRSTKG